MVKADKAAVEKLQEILKEHTDRPKTIRIYLAGMGWGGPSFGLALDEQKENDLVKEVDGVTFIMDKGVQSDHGDFVIESMGNGFRVVPESQSNDSGCGGCSGGC